LGKRILNGRCVAAVYLWMVILLRRRWQLGLVIQAAILMSACDPYRDTRPITMIAKPPLIERQFCMALRDAERAPQDSVVMTGIAVHGTPDVFRVSCEAEQHELIFVLSPPPDDLNMKELRKQWNKKTGAKSVPCGRCPKYDLTAKFVGMVKRDDRDPTRLMFVVQGADEIRRHRIRYGAR